MEMNKIKGYYHDGQYFKEMKVEFPIEPDSWGYSTQVFNIGDDYFWVEVWKSNPKYKELNLPTYMIEFGYNGENEFVGSEANEIYFAKTFHDLAFTLKQFEPLIEIAKRNERLQLESQDELFRKDILKELKQISYEIRHYSPVE